MILLQKITQRHKGTKNMQINLCVLGVFAVRSSVQTYHAGSLYANRVDLRYNQPEREHFVKDKDDGRLCA
jgi:hypothetical protein